MTWLLLLDTTMDAAAEEALRIGVGALAAGATVQVVASVDAMADLDAGALSAAAEEYARALTEGAPCVRWEQADWAALLAGCRHIVRAARSDRSGAPRLCVVTDAWIQDTEAAAVATAVREAGQLVRVKSEPAGAGPTS